MSETKNILINKLSFAFGDEQVLSNIDLNVAQGEFLSILGASGSGKSTLLRIIAGILPSGQNETMSGSINIHQQSPAEYMQTGELSFMFQDPSLMPNLNVQKNIEFPLKLRGKKINKEFILSLIESVGLSDAKHKLPSELSGGMKTRVSLARAFATKPKLILLDEPFSALDISWKYTLYNYLNELASDFGSTVILVTHDIQEAILLSNRVFVLSKKGSFISDKVEFFEKEQFINYEIARDLLTQEKVFQYQTDILLDAYRYDLTLEKCIQDLEKVLYKPKVKEEKISHKEYVALISSQPYLDNERVQTIIIDIWESLTSFSDKYQVMWRLIEIDGLDYKYHEEVFHSIKGNWAQFKRRVKKDPYFENSEILRKTKEAINDVNLAHSKDWLYLINTVAITEGTSKETACLKYLAKYIQQNQHSKYTSFLEPFIKMAPQS